MDKDTLETIAEFGYPAAGAAGIGGAAGAYAAKKIDERKQTKPKRSARQRRTAQLKAGMESQAKEKLQRLQSINPKDLETRDRKIRTQLIKEQKEAIKGNKIKTPTSLLKSLGLRALPAVGAFIAMLSPTPAYGQGGKVCRGRSAQGSAEKS